MHLMFIVVYKEGGQVDHPLTLDSYYEANKLPGEKYIFEWSRGKYTPYDEKGVWCYENGQKGHFVHGDYYLTDIVYKVKNIVEFVFRYKTTEDVTIKYNLLGGFPKGLSYAIKEILLASKFNSWNEYVKNKADIKEMEKLKAENIALKLENEGLKEKLSHQNQPA